MQANHTPAVIEQALPKKKPPKVSVCVVTYNQKKYIAQCLQSIVDQETDFDFEIIVGDDCSTDGTREIVLGFADKYPGKFRILCHPRNIGAAFNYLRTHEMATGEYVAHIDGDDLMLPHKLQRQANALEENPKCVMVTHDMLIINGEGAINRRTFKRHRGGVNTLWNLYKTLPFFAHSSRMVKREVESKTFPVISKDTLDIELHVATAEIGDIFHIDEPLGIYRSGTGISASKKTFVNPLLIEGCRRIFEESIVRYPEKSLDLRKSYARAMLNYAYQSAILKNKEDYIAFLMQSRSIYRYSILRSFLSIFPTPIVFKLIELRSKIFQR